MRSTRFLAMLVAFVLLVAACGDGEGDATTTAAATTDNETTTTAAPADSTTTAAPQTTTTAAPATTTTAAPETTTTQGAVVTTEEANELAQAKTGAALAVVPEGWTTELSNDLVVETGTDDVFSVCTEDDEFDLNQLESLTAGVSTLMADAPPAAGSFFPAGNASVEARIFESDGAAADAFAVLEEVYGSEAGRQCIADQFLSEMLQDLPEGEEAPEFMLDEIDVPGADVAIRISLSMEVEGFSFAFFIELVAARDGECTVYATFLGFNEPFDEELRNDLFQAAADF